MGSAIVIGGDRIRESKLRVVFMSVVTVSLVIDFERQLGGHARALYSSSSLSPWPGNLIPRSWSPEQS